MLTKRFTSLPRILLSPVPLVVLQPILAMMVHRIAGQHSEFFDRLGEHCRKTFLIHPTNLPFVLALTPDPDHLSLRAYRSADEVEYQASITGSFLGLLRLIDGRQDGDALFFSRDLKIEGDTEAIVCLRNALDDVEGSIAQDVASMFGMPGRAGLRILRRMEA